MTRFILCPVAPARLILWALPLASLVLLGASFTVHAADARAASATAPVATAASPGDPFSAYQRWRDDPLTDWPGANDRVGEIGGWMTYLREAQEPADAAAPAEAGHHSHH